MPSFDNIVDAIAMIKGEDPDTSDMFMLVNKTTKAGLIKAIKDDAKYSENYVVKGGISYIAGVKVVVSKMINDSVTILATKQAVTIFNKKGTSIERDKDIKTKKNSIVASKYFVVALTDEGYAVKIGKAVTKPTITTGTKATKSIAGACSGADEVEIYLNGVLIGNGTVASNSYTFTAKDSLAAGDKIIVKAYAKDKASATSDEFTVE